jgi:uncharacterized protein
MNKKIILLLLVLILTINSVFAQKNTIKLLAVNDETKQGIVVELGLNIIDGIGKVFLETYPLSQLDIQISLRIAKTIACQMFDNYCLNKDFMYSVTTNSPIVAGPSAGASITLLTIATLENKKIDSNTIMTGTINSGGVVGIVGGVKEKIKAAADANMKKVLIPKGETNATELVEYGKSLNLTIIEISDIEEAYAIFTGEKKTYPDLIVNDKYKIIMKNLNNEICTRTKELELQIIDKEIPKKYNLTKNFGLNLSEQADELFDQGDYYASTSRCFGANVYLREALFASMNISKEDIKRNIHEIETKLDELDRFLNETKVSNLGDLEVTMIIKERVNDARKNIEDFDNSSSLRDLSYAMERSYSAASWKEFLGFSDKKIDQAKLKEGCELKIQEVNELYNYVQLYVPSLLEESRKELEKAKEHLNTGDYALCLFIASKSKAEIDATLSTIYIEDSNVDSLLVNKFLAAKKTIQKQIKQGNFPILGYSYYEYADALREKEKYSALLYSEYSIELSNLDMYFPQKKPLEIKINQNALITLIAGFIIGVTVFYFNE